MTAVLLFGAVLLLSRSQSAGNASLASGLQQLGRGLSSGLTALSKGLQQKSSGGGSGGGSGPSNAQPQFAPSAGQSLLQSLLNYARTPANLQTSDPGWDTGYSIPYVPDPSVTPVDASTDPFLVSSPMSYGLGTDSTDPGSTIDYVGGVDANTDPFLVTSPIDSSGGGGITPVDSYDYAGVDSSGDAYSGSDFPPIDFGSDQSGYSDSNGDYYGGWDPSAGDMFA